MALDFEWNGNRWEAKKVRRKLTQYEHKGVAYYDRERMRQPLEPIHHARDWQGYSNPLPSWIDQSWQAADSYSEPTSDSLDDESIAETGDYVYETCHVETMADSRYDRVNHRMIKLATTYLYEIRFDDARFRFVSREIADAALSELLKIRSAKHPRPKFGAHSPDAPFFTDRRLAKLSAESYARQTQPADNAAAVEPMTVPRQALAGLAIAV